ncbi:MAG TPA: YciI family protein [Streptosporangiaceae bacterium]|nr:YciI family protein [Streptosporangiaceae bacterium]
MSSASLEAAYAPFIASLLAGGFGPPPDGEWPAELVAAHVARNNDLIAKVVEQVAAGEQVGYDNADEVDEVKLASYAAEAGGAAGLAGEVERSAARLERARDALGNRAGTLVHVVIRDHDQVVQDGPIPIGQFIEGNATFHLDLHLEQLKSLELSSESGPPDEFDSYQLVLLERSPTAPELDEAAAAVLQRQHLGHFAKMRRAGLLMVAGPVRGHEAVAGICVYRARTPERARALAEDDPAVRAGWFVVRVMSWLTPKDAIGWP